MSEPIKVFRARKILTMARNRPVATHVALREGRILAVGDAEDAAGWGAPIDDRFADKVLMPGLIEAHCHAMADGCDRHLPGFRRSPATGGSCLWLECPPEIDGRALAERAAGLGVLIESGDPFMPEAQAGRFIRLGISYISERRIDPGLERLGRAALK